MKKEKEFEARIFRNRRNDQHTVVPIKRNLSKEVRQLLDNPDVVGLRMEVVEVYKKMPPIRFKLSTAARRKFSEYQRKYLKKRKEVIKWKE